MPPSDEQPEQGLSLRGLTEAFARALGRTGPPLDESPEPGTSTKATSPTAAPAAEELPQQGWEEAEPIAPEEDAAFPISPGVILEAMLFVDNSENRPLTAQRAAELMRGVDASEIGELVGELNRRYRANNCPYRVEAEGAGYRLEIGGQYHALRNKFYGRIREARLSQAAIDVLAIVAYRQPLGGEEVSRLRDKPSGHLLAQLVRRRLLAIERPEGQPRRALYRTTERFLGLFGLESLADLPQAEEPHRH